MLDMNNNLRKVISIPVLIFCACNLSYNGERNPEVSRSFQASWLMATIYFMISAGAFKTQNSLQNDEMVATRLVNVGYCYLVNIS